MTGLAAKVFTDTWKQQFSTPSNIYDFGQMICRTIQKCSAEEDPTVSKIQNLVLNPARNLLCLYTLQDNFSKFCETPVMSKGLQAIKNTCDVLPIFSAINLIESASLEYIPYVKVPVTFIQSTHSLYDSVGAASPSGSLNRLNKLEAKSAVVKKFLEQLTIVDNALQSRDPSKGNSLYEACRKLEELIPATDRAVDSKARNSLGILHRMILNSEDINKNLTVDEISKLKKILDECIDQGCEPQALQNISEKFKVYLDTVDYASNTKTLLEVLKAAISWILGASSMLNLFFAGFAISGAALLSLELCSFIVRLVISAYKSYLSNLSTF